MSDENPYAPPPQEPAAYAPYVQPYYPPPAPPKSFWTPGKVILATIVVLLAVLGALALIGLLMGAADDNGSASQDTSKATTTSGTSDRDTYFALIRNQLDLSEAEMSDAELIDVANTMCEARAAGVTEDALVDMAIDSDFSAFNAGYYVRATLNTFCPGA